MDLELLLRERELDSERRGVSRAVSRQTSVIAKLKERAMAILLYPKSGLNILEAKAQRKTFWRDGIRRWKLSGLSKTDFCNSQKRSRPIPV